MTINKEKMSTTLAIATIREDVDCDDEIDRTMTASTRTSSSQAQAHEDMLVDVELATGVTIEAIEAAVLEGNDESSSSHSSSVISCSSSQHRITELADYQKLHSDPSIRRRCLWTIRFAVAAVSVSNTILQPNYPIMVTPNATPDSFKSTAPFDFNSATYFIPLTALLGLAITSLFAGTLSDKVGRRPMLLVTTFGGALGAAIKWCFRKSFWAFCGANFFTGLISSNLPVAMAYVSDVCPSKTQKDKELSILTACFIFAQSAGGIVSIFMQSTGLFDALWVGCGMLLLSGLFLYLFLIEPKREYALTIAAQLKDKKDDGDASSSSVVVVVDAPDKIDRRSMINIIAGAVADQFGSTGLFALSLSPLAYNHYYTDFANQGLSPIMTLEGYKWISVSKFHRFIIKQYVVVAAGTTRKKH